MHAHTIGLGITNHVGDRIIAVGIHKLEIRDCGMEAINQLLQACIETKG